jgi:hypothetical protein
MVERSRHDLSRKVFPLKVRERVEMSLRFVGNLPGRAKPKT